MNIKFAMMVYVDRPDQRSMSCLLLIVKTK